MAHQVSCWFNINISGILLHITFYYLDSQVVVVARASLLCNDLKWCRNNPSFFMALAMIVLCTVLCPIVKMQQHDHRTHFISFHFINMIAKKQNRRERDILFDSTSCFWWRRHAAAWRHQPAIKRRICIWTWSQSVAYCRWEDEEEEEGALAGACGGGRHCCGALLVLAAERVHLLLSSQ